MRPKFKRTFSLYLVFFLFSLSYSNGTSTTVLKKHLLHTHRINITTEHDELKQKRLTDIFISKKNIPIPENKNRNDERYILGRRLSLWLCKDLLPFSIVEYKGFQDFWSSLHVNISLPTRQTITIAALDDMYLCVKNELINTLGNSGGKRKSTTVLTFSFWLVHCVHVFVAFPVGKMKTKNRNGGQIYIFIRFSFSYLYQQLSLSFSLFFFLTFNQF